MRTHLASGSRFPHSENRHTCGMFRTGDRTFHSHWQLLLTCLHFPTLQRRLKRHLRNNQFASVTAPVPAGNYSTKLIPGIKCSRKKEEQYIPLNIVLELINT